VTDAVPGIRTGLCDNVGLTLSFGCDDVGSAGTSLNYPALRTTTIGLHRHTSAVYSARAQKIFPIRNMRPLSIREATRPGDLGVFSPALDVGDCVVSGIMIMIQETGDRPLP